MKHIITTTAVLIFASITNVAYATNYRGAGEAEYYLGADAQYRFIKPAINYNELFKKHHSGGDLYAGWRFHKDFGLELGYAWSTRISKDNQFNVGQTILPNLVLNRATEVTGKVRYRNTHLDVNGYYAIYKNLDGILTLGLGFVRPHVTFALSDQTANLNNELNNIACKTNALVRFGAGLDGMLGDYWGVRSIVRYENTSSTSVRDAGVGGNKIWRNNISVGLGFYRYFD